MQIALKITYFDEHNIGLAIDYQKSFVWVPI